MGSNVSTNGCGPSFGNLVEFVGLEGDVDEHMTQASVKRKRRHEKRHQKRHKRDAHNQRRRQRQRRALRNAKGNSGSGARNNGKENVGVTKQDYKKMKSRHKSMESEIEARIIDTIQHTLLVNKKTRKDKDFREKNNDKLKENRQRKQDPKSYDLTGDDLTKIYDLRTLYDTVAGGHQEARDPYDRNECHTGSNATEGFQDTGFQFFTQARKGPGLRRSVSMSRSKTVDLTNHSQKEHCDQKGLLKRSNSQYSSLRESKTSPKRSTFARFSLRFPGLRSSKQEISKSLPVNRGNGIDPFSRNPYHPAKRIDSYLDQSFLESDVSFHMQGPPKLSHVVLASASAVSSYEKGRNFHRFADLGSCDKENELLDQADSRKEGRPFGFGRLGCRKQTRTLKLSNGRVTVPCDTIEEESEYSLHAAKSMIIENNQTVKKVYASANSEMCSSGVTPVYLAAQEGHLQVLQELVAAGGRMDHPAADGLTPVHAAAQMGCTEVLQYMISLDPRLVHIRDADGATPLHFSSSRGHLSAAKLLLKSGASPDHADLWGKTPVHDALENRHHEMVRLLMQHSDVPAASSTDCDSKGRHSSGSSSSGSSKKGSSGRNSNTNTRRRQSSRQPSASSQSPFYLHPPDDASSPKTSPPSPCSHHAPQEEIHTRNTQFCEEEDPEDNTLDGSEMTTSTIATAANHSAGHSKTNGVQETTFNGHSRSNSNHSSSSMRSNSRNSDESRDSNSGDSINSADGGGSHSSSSSSMLQELRETATQQQQQQQQSSSSGSEQEPFYLHDSEAQSGNASPLQKLFSRTHSRGSRSGSERRSSVKSNRSGEESTERVLRHLQSLDDLVTGVPPPDYETGGSSPSPAPSPAPRTHHSPLARVRSEPVARSSVPSSSSTGEVLFSPNHSLPHQPLSPSASCVGGYVPPPPPPPPAPLIVPEKNNVLETEEISSPTAKSFQHSSSEGDAFSHDSDQEDKSSSNLTKEQLAATDGGESTLAGETSEAGNHPGSAASRGLASISIAQLQSVQLRKTQPRDHSKSHSVPLTLEPVEKSSQSEVIEELKRSVDVGSPSKLKHQQQQQQQQQVQENLQVQITPEQIMNKVPQVDSSGLPIPEWKRQMLARRAAEKATAEEQQNRLHQLEMKRLQQLPPWKRQLLEKRSSGSSTPSALYMPRVVEPRKISVALTASR